MAKHNDNSTPRKKAPFIFYLILGLIPIFFFIFLESLLHLLDYGHDYKVFKEKEDGIPGMIYVNPDLSYKYFGNLNSKVFNSQIGFHKEKQRNSLRIFVLGGSSAQGFPYNTNASFPAHLKRRLEITYPSKLIEVVNLGASAINSYTLRDMLPEVLEHSPDIVLIYAGHNEYYGALGAGSSIASNTTLAYLILYLRDFRTMQLMENLIRRFSSKGSQKDKNLMQKMIGKSMIDFGSSTYTNGIKQFQVNIAAILNLLKDSNTPVIIGTLASNIKDQRPFNSSQTNSQGLSANDLYKQGKELLALGRYDEAKAYLTLSKEFDGLRFRAPEAINSIIQTQAKNIGVPVVNIDREFSLKSIDNIIGYNLMCDHLHPNLAGYFLMSKLFFNSIIDNELISEPKDQVQSISNMDSILLNNFPYTAFDTIVDNHILYSGLGQYPFVDPGKPNLYQELLDSYGLNFNTSSLDEKDSVRSIIAGNHLTKGDSSSFTKEMSVFLSQFPYNDIRYLHAINLLSRSGKLEMGYHLIYENLISMRNSYAKNKALGIYHKYIKQYDSALFYLNNIVESNAYDELAQLDIGFIHLEMSNYTAAETVFTEVIKNSPHNQEAYHQRSIARFELKDYSGTIDDISKSMSLKRSPDSLSYLIRGYAHLGRKEKTKACKDWQKSADLGSKQALSLINKLCN